MPTETTSYSGSSSVVRACKDFTQIRCMRLWLVAHVRTDVLRRGSSRKSRRRHRFCSAFAIDAQGIYRFPTIRRALRRSCQWRKRATFALWSELRRSHSLVICASATGRRSDREGNESLPRAMRFRALPGRMLTAFSLPSEWNANQAIVRPIAIRQPFLA